MHPIIHNIHPMTTTLIIGLLIPLLGTMLGSAVVFFMRGEMSVRLQKALLGFASGVMVAASVWSLLMPAREREADSGKGSGLRWKWKQIAADGV